MPEITNNQKRMIAEYMGWEPECVYGGECLIITEDECLMCEHASYNYRNFDLNEAGECVQMMVEKGDFISFNVFTMTRWLKTKDCTMQYDAYLFNPDNFFTAFVEWLERKRVLA